MSNVTIAIERITPSIAKKWLEQNTFNRGIQSKVIEQYAQDMEAGRWNMTGDPIKFAKTGEMLDGQHRLLAIIKTGMPQNLAIARGLDKEVFYQLDKGKKRSFHDVLAINEYSNTAITAATVRLCYIYHKTKFEGFKNATPLVHNYDILMRFLDRNKSIKKSIKNQISLGRNFMIPDSILATFHWILKQIDEDKANDFIFKMTTGLELHRGDPIYVVRRKIEQIRRQGALLRRQEYMNMMAQGWNAFIKKEPLHGLVVKTGADVPPLESI